MDPVRVLDTRETKQRIKAGTTLTLPIAGKHGIPTTGTGSVAFNLTIVNPTGPGFLTAFPDGTERPKTSTINFVEDQIVANGVIGKLGTNGAISLYSMTDVDVIIDITGWFPATANYQTITPTRAIDTRQTNQRLQPKTSLAVDILGKHGIPATGVAAVTYNLTAVDPATPGFLTAHPSGADRPTTSNVNYEAQQNVANGVITQVGDDGKIAIYSMSEADVIVDITGWFPTDGEYVSVVPARALDSRETKQRIPAKGSLTLKLAGKNGIPATGATAVAYNLTAVDPAGPGFVTAYPAGAEKPLASNVNYPAEQDVANNVITKLGTDGSITLYSMTEVDVIVDVTGWFAAEAASGMVNTMIKTPDGVPGTVRLESTATGDSAPDPVIVTKDTTGTESNTSSKLSAGQYKVVPQPVVVEGVVYAATATPAMVDLSRDQSVDVVVTYTKSDGVQKLVASTVTASMVDLAWETNATEVMVRRVEGRVAPESATAGDLVESAAKTASDKTVKPGTVYSYRVFPVVDGTPVSDLAKTAEITVETPQEPMQDPAAAAAWPNLLH